jgi:hypothetical protein
MEKGGLTMEKHTATPWVAGSPNFQRWNNAAIWRQGKADSFIAEVFGHDKEDGEANAAFIVRACNAHEALVGFVTSFLALCPSSEGLGGHAPMGAFLSLADKARAALELARVQP